MGESKLMLPTNGLFPMDDMSEEGSLETAIADRQEQALQSPDFKIDELFLARLKQSNEASRPQIAY